MDFVLLGERSFIRNVHQNVRFRLSNLWYYTDQRMFSKCNFDFDYTIVFNHNTKGQDGFYRMDKIEYLIFDGMANKIVYPVMIQTEEEVKLELEEGRKKLFYFGSSQISDSQRVFPADIFLRVITFETFVLTGLPDRVDYGAFGTNQLKFKQFLHECEKDTSTNCGPFEVDQNVNEQWKTRQCHQIQNQRLCELCFLQFYGLDAKSGEATDRCKNKQSLNGKQIMKCTNKCPRVRFMYNETEWSRQKYEEVFSDYKLCNSARKVTDYCHINGTMKHFDDNQSSGLLTPDTSGTP